MLRRIACVLALLLTSTLSAAELPSTEWPQFHRDARRSGDNPQAELKFPLERTTAVRFPAPIYASPAVANGKVYIQDALGNVACIDPDANRAIWTTNIGGINNTSSPAVQDGRVYVGSSRGALAILDANDGKLLREVPANGAVLTAPALANGSVYFSTLHGKLTKITPAGDVVWTFDGGKLGTVDFAIWEKDILFFAGKTVTNLYRLRDEGSAVKEISKTPAPSNCVPVAGPAFVTAETYSFPSFDSEFGRFYYMSKTGKLLVNTDLSDSRIVPAVRDGVIYRGDKTFKYDEGFKLQWRTEASQLYDGGSHSSPALGKNVLAIGCERGLVHFLALDGTGKTRRPLWQYRTERAGEPNSAVSSSPAIVNGRVFFGGEDGILYGLGNGEAVSVADVQNAKGRAERVALKGAEWPTPGCDMGFSYVSPDVEVRPPFAVEWKTRIWSVFKAPMIVAESRVFCSGRLGNLTCLDARTGEILWKTHHPGVESRPAPTFADGKLLLMRIRNGQGDSPYVSSSAPSGGPPGEGLYCHDAATGKLLWHKPMAFKYHFNHDGLAVHAGKVIVEEVANDGKVQFVAYSLDSGEEAWRRTLDGVQNVGAKGPLKLPPRFSGIIAGGLFCVSISDKGTFGINPDDGTIVWKETETFITRRTRIAARDGVLVVFAGEGDHAFDARTGKKLWTGAAKASSYVQALSDRYMKSEGKQGVFPTATCAWPIYANGHWYSHQSYSTQHGANTIAAMKDPEGDVEFLGEKLVKWTYAFLSNACPSPTPAYGRLFYSPSSEGVVYSFVPVK